MPVFAASVARLEKTRAILLRKIRYGNSSLIVSWLTADHGRIKTIAKGALRPKSAFAGVLDLFHDCDIAFLRSRKSDIHTLREVWLENARMPLRSDYPRVALAAYFVELIETTTEADHPAPELFELAGRALSHLEKKAASRSALLHFEKELARLLGIEHPELTPIVTIGRTYHRIPAARPGLLKTLPEKPPEG